MRGLKQLRCAQVISTGHAFVHNIRRGHYELGTEEVVKLRVRAAFDELAWRSDQPGLTISPTPTSHNATGPVIHLDATLSQQFFHVSVGEPVAQVPANRDRDQIRREAEPREAGPR